MSTFLTLLRSTEQYTQSSVVLSHVVEVDIEVYSQYTQSSVALCHVVEVNIEVYSVSSPPLSSLTLLRLILRSTVYPVLSCPLSHIIEVDKEVYSVSSPRLSSLSHFLG